MTWPPAEELILYLAGSLGGGRAVGHQLLEENVRGVMAEGCVRVIEEEYSSHLQEIKRVFYMGN